MNFYIAGMGIIYTATMQVFLEPSVLCGMWLGSFIVITHQMAMSLVEELQMSDPSFADVATLGRIRDLHQSKMTST